MTSVRDALSESASTADVAFRRRFDVASTSDWSELVRDVVALANSGGGVVLIGVEMDGEPAGLGDSNVAGLTAAEVDARVREFTGSHLAGIRISKEEKQRRAVLAIEVEAEPYPLVFVKSAVESSLFAAGTVWFRHGPRSEPGTVEDLRKAFEREIGRRSDGWLENFRRVLGSPPGSVVAITMPTAVAGAGEPGLAVRLVSDPYAPAVPRWSPDETHPHRLKDVIARVNERLAGRAQVNSFDLLSVRREYETDRIASFVYRSRMGGPQYSDAFIDWIVEQFAKDPAFFANARAKAPRWKRPAR